MKKKQGKLTPADGKEPHHFHHADRNPDPNPPKVHTKTINEREVEKLFIAPPINPNKP